MANWKDLPIELRTEIYNNLWRFEDALVVPQAIYTKRASETRAVRTRSQVTKTEDATVHSHWKNCAHIVSASSQFLRCSKQVYNEGLVILYGDKFNAGYINSFPDFAKKSAEAATQFDGLVSLETLTYFIGRVDVATNISPIPPHVPNDTSDPLLRTRSARPNHLMTDFLDAIASRHPHAKMTVNLGLSVTDRQPGGPGRMLYITEYWQARYTIQTTEQGLNVIYIPDSRKFHSITSW